MPFHSLATKVATFSRSIPIACKTSRSRTQWLLESNRKLLTPCKQSRLPHRKVGQWTAICKLHSNNTLVRDTLGSLLCFMQSWLQHRSYNTFISSAQVFSTKRHAGKSQHHYRKTILADEGCVFLFPSILSIWNQDCISRWASCDCSDTLMRFTVLLDSLESVVTPW